LDIPQPPQGGRFRCLVPFRNRAISLRFDLAYPFGDFAAARVAGLVGCSRNRPATF
jgi:hypothetical protein